MRDILILMDNGNLIQFSFEEPQTELTSIWIDEMLADKSEQNKMGQKSTQMQYGPTQKRGKGKVKKW